MSEDKLRLDVERANRAKQIIEDELLAGAFAALKKSYMSAWETTQFRDTDARERLWQAFQIVGKVESHLHGVLASGEIAQREIEQLQNFGERRKIFGIV